MSEKIVQLNEEVINLDTTRAGTRPQMLGVPIFYAHTTQERKQKYGRGQDLSLYVKPLLQAFTRRSRRFFDDY